MILDRNKIDDMPQRYRANLINSLSGFKSANLIGTTNTKGQHNLSIVSSVVHFGANPPIMGFVMRPNSVPRDSLDNILETKHFSINQVSADFWQQAHQTAARYPKDISEFEQTELTAELLSNFPAPFVAQSMVKIGLTLLEIIDIKANGTKLILGEIDMLDIDTTVLREDGYLDIESIDAVAISGLDSYHVTHRLSRLSYAKPDQTISQLTIDGKPI